MPEYMFTPIVGENILFLHNLLFKTSQNSCLPYEQLQKCYGIAQNLPLSLTFTLKSLFSSCL